MALTISTVTPTPTGNNTTGKTFTMTSIGADFAVNDMVVVMIAADNAGSGGNAANITSLADTAGNTWTERSNTWFDNGAASAGIEEAIYTCRVTNAISSTDDLTITFNVTVVAKAVTIYKIANDGTLRGEYVTTGTHAGATTGTPALTSGSVTSGDTLFYHIAREGNSTPTGDSDTTNGNWSTIAFAGYGTTTGGAIDASQWKTVTSTATQTWNPTFTSGDTKASWITITPQTFGSAGSGTPTDVRDAASGVGKLNYSSSGSPTDVRDTASGAAVFTVTSSGSPTDVRDTASGAAVIRVSSSGSPTDVRDTASGAATAGTTSSSSGSPTDVRDTASGSAVFTVTSSGTPTDTRDTASGAAVIRVSSSGTPTDTRDAASGAAVIRVSSSGSPTDTRDTASGASTSAAPSNPAGVGTPTDTRDAAAGQVVFRISASGAVTDTRDVVAGAAGDGTTPQVSPGGPPLRQRRRNELAVAVNDDDEVLLMFFALD